MTVDEVEKSENPPRPSGIPRDRMKMTEAVVEAIRNKILSGEIKPGDRVRQDDLAYELNVSRMPIREAILRLEGEGFVQTFHHRSPIVAPLTVAELQELFGLRSLLEPNLLKLALPQFRADDLARTEEILREYDRIVVEEPTRSDLWDAPNWEFHCALYRPARQPKSMQFLDSIHQQLLRYQKMAPGLNKALPNDRDDHWELLDLCRRNRAVAACDLLENHIRRAGDSAVEYYRERLPAIEPS